ncbi:ribonuclease-like [Carettochelys insculpta]|uniref:ribonuclease-like n=1 Tax=Carettochelys insculpta TaxID=44489 RepID=UPI003EBD6138
MAPRGPRLLLLLPLGLLAAGLAQLSQGASYQDFRRRHVDFPRSGPANGRLYCNLLMRRRGLTRPVCKPTNTFIHAPTHQIRAICTHGGRCHGRNFCDSRSSFSLTTCRVAPGSRPGHCIYRARAKTRRVRVACRGRLPVHFERIL